jgi:hypothetical protein
LSARRWPIPGSGIVDPASEMGDLGLGIVDPWREMGDLGPGIVHP